MIETLCFMDARKTGAWGDAVTYPSSRGLALAAEIKAKCTDLQLRVLFTANW